MKIFKVTESDCEVHWEKTLSEISEQLNKYTRLGFIGAGVNSLLVLAATNFPAWIDTTAKDYILILISTVDSSLESGLLIGKDFGKSEFV